MLMELHFLAVINTETGEWLETNGPESTTSGSIRQNQNQLMRRYRHAAASVGSRIYVYGGVKEGKILKFSNYLTKNNLYIFAFNVLVLWDFAYLSTGTKFADLIFLLCVKAKVTIL